MAFLDSMKDRITNASQSTVQKAKDLSEIAKLNAAISEAEKQIGELYGKIGYEVYCAYFENPLPEVAELIKQVIELHHKIDECKEQIKVINAVASCPQCGTKIIKGKAFCGECGYKFLVSEPVAQAAFCGNCGAPISAGAVFCTSCGTKIS